jgi:hypothetical protein
MPAGTMDLWTLFIIAILIVKHICINTRVAALTRLRSRRGKRDAAGGLIELPHANGLHLVTARRHARRVWRLLPKRRQA